jgi:hypothetical protein
MDTYLNLIKIFIWKGGIMYVNGPEKEVKAIEVKEAIFGIPNR